MELFKKDKNIFDTKWDALYDELALKFRKKQSEAKEVSMRKTLELVGGRKIVIFGENKESGYSMRVLE